MWVSEGVSCEVCSDVDYVVDSACFLMRDKRCEVCRPEVGYEVGEKGSRSGSRRVVEERRGVNVVVGLVVVVVLLMVV